MIAGESQIYYHTPMFAALSKDKIIAEIMAT